MRNSLLENQSVKLASADDASRTRTFTIQKVLGNGSSCIAYRAVDANKILVVIKECFPRNAAVREKSGAVAWNTADDESRAKERFIAAFDAESDNAERFIRLVRRYTEFPELTGTILNEYIEKIIVYEADKSNGRREQDVEIYFSFIGRFDVPGQPEPEPFNLYEHRKALWRANYYRAKERLLAEPPEVQEAKAAQKREYNRQWRARKKKERVAAEVKPLVQPIPMPESEPAQPQPIPAA